MTSPQQPAPPTDSERVFRSNAGMAGGALLLALMGWMVVDAVVAGEGRTPWLALAGTLLAAPLVVAFTLRPAVFVGEDRIRIRNPFRSIVLPWGTVSDVRASYSSEIFTQSGTKYQLWAIPVSLRKRKIAARRQAQAAHDDPHGRTSVHADVGDSKSRVAPTDQTIADLRELAERRSHAPEAQGEPQIRWAYEVLAPAAAGAVLLAILLATA
ncbi:PH domain-containing protein [Streptomyces peucetius]|uniref:PH domain-containing protein n=1 Tax=Streptomyces peucetius TaxID=1950 RepID=A0ABY6IAK9_STRPE|nr:PH domain-containing protein [Streptomyces peucetius]UYQ64049.1 PH domain-containing protein [Streptomyces peucetius]